MMVGRKVLCVNDRAIPRTASVKGAPLVEGMIYTVREIETKNVRTFDARGTITVGVRLDENEVFHMEFDSEAWWQAARFLEIQPEGSASEVTHVAEPLGV